MLVSRLWGRAGLWVGLYVVTAFLEAGIGIEEGAGLLLLLACYLVLWIVPGFQGNAWRAKNLLSRGFELVSTVKAPTKDAATASASKIFQAQLTASGAETPPLRPGGG